MATLTHGTTAATIADDIISFNINFTDETVDVPTMDNDPGDVVPFLMSYTGGEATVEAYGEIVPDEGDHVTVSVAGESIEGWVTSVGGSGSEGGVATYSVTIQIGDDGTPTL